MEKPFCDLPAGALADVRLIETLGYVPGAGARRAARHLDRMGRSARALGFPFERGAAEARLAAVSGAVPLRLRLTLDATGGLELTRAALPPTPARWRLRLSPRRLDASNPWLAHKTTRRALYDATRAALPDGIDEVLFANRAGGLCEGTISNLFLRPGGDGDGPLMTPPLAAGCLPGILRGELLESGRAVEAPLELADLQGAALFMGNALRGLIPADLR